MKTKLWIYSFIILSFYFGNPDNLYVGLLASNQMNKMYLITEVFQNILLNLQIFTYWLIEYE